MKNEILICLILLFFIASCKNKDNKTPEMSENKVKPPCLYTYDDYIHSPGIKKNKITVSDSTLKIEESLDFHTKIDYYFNRRGNLIHYSYLRDEQTIYFETYAEDGSAILKAGLPTDITMHQHNGNYVLHIIYFSRSNTYSNVVFRTDEGDTVKPHIKSMDSLNGIPGLLYSKIACPYITINDKKRVIYFDFETKDNCTDEISKISDSMTFNINEDYLSYIHSSKKQ